MCVASHVGPRVGWCVAIACRLYQRSIGAFRNTRFCLHVRGKLRVNKFYNLWMYLLSKNIANIPEETLCSSHVQVVGYGPRRLASHDCQTACVSVGGAMKLCANAVSTRLGSVTCVMDRIPTRPPASKARLRSVSVDNQHRCYRVVPTTGASTSTPTTLSCVSVSACMSACMAAPR